MKEPNWVTVYQSSDEYIVRIYKLKLEAHEIPVSIFDQRDSSYNAFGYIYLNVRAEDEQEALKLIEETNE
ncbi:MAG: putative signal transducing protein [Crocinitomicaceae bacterium]